MGLYFGLISADTYRNNASIQISGSGTADIMDQCTYLSTNCSILQVGPTASLGTSDAPMGDVSISVASNNNTQATYGKLLIQGNAYVGNIKVGTSENAALLPKNDHSSGFGFLEVAGNSAALTANLHANKIYLPGAAPGDDWDDFISGYGIIKIGPYATVAAEQLILGQQPNYITPYISNSNQLTIQGPDTTLKSSGAVQIGNFHAGNGQISLPIDINILNGGILTAKDGLTIQGPPTLTSQNGNLATINISSDNPSELSQMNVNAGTLQLEDSNIINIGNPQGTLNTTTAELNINSGNTNEVVPTKPNVSFSGNSTVNIYPQGMMSIPNTSAITMNNNAKIDVNGGKLTITGENTSLRMTDNASITVPGGDVTIGNPATSSANVVMGNNSSLSFGVNMYFHTYIPSVATINGTLNLSSNASPTPVIVKPTGQLNVKSGIVFSGDKQFIVLQQAFGQTAKLSVRKELDPHNVLCSYPTTAGGWYYLMPNKTVEEDGGTLYSCAIHAQSTPNSKALNTQQLNNAFGNSAK